MARDRGQIEKRGEGKYLIRVYIGRIDGKRKYLSKTIQGTRKQADAELTRWLREMDTHTFVAPADTQRFLMQVVDEWFEAKRPGLTPITLRNYRSLIEQHIRPHLGHLRMAHLNEHSLQTWVNTLHGLGFAHGTIQAARQLLGQVIKLAIRRGYLIRNPLLGVEMPRKSSPDRTAGVLTADQIRAVLEATKGQRYHALWALLLGTGLRPQEACALQWGDLGADGTLHLRRVLRFWESRVHLEISDEGKTGASLVPIQLPEATLGVLRAHRKEQLQDQLREGYRNEDGWIFCTRTGEVPLLGNVRRAWKAALRKAGVPEVKLYATRHTHATLLAEANVPMKAIQGRLRHSSIRTTMDFYSRATPQMDAQAADTFDKLLKEA